MKRNLTVLACVAIVATAIVSVGFAEKEKQAVIPDAITAALKAMFPQATVKEAEKAKESLTVYEATLTEGGKEFDATLTADGMVAEVSSGETADTLPDAVKAAVAGGKVKEASKETSYTELKYVKLAAPVTTYEVCIEKDGQEIEMTFSADGGVISQKVEKAEKGENGKDDEENDEDKD